MTSPAVGSARASQTVSPAIVIHWNLCFRSFCSASLTLWPQKYYILQITRRPTFASIGEGVGQTRRISSSQAACIRVASRKSPWDIFTSPLRRRGNPQPHLTSVKGSWRQSGGSPINPSQSGECRLRGHVSPISQLFQCSTHFSINNLHIEKEPPIDCSINVSSGSAGPYTGPFCHSCLSS